MEMTVFSSGGIRIKKKCSYNIMTHGEQSLKDSIILLKRSYMYRKNCLEHSMLSNTEVSRNRIEDKTIPSVLNKNKKIGGAFYLVGGIKCKV